MCRAIARAYDLEIGALAVDGLACITEGEAAASQRGVDEAMAAIAGGGPHLTIIGFASCPVIAACERMHDGCTTTTARRTRQQTGRRLTLARDGRRRVRPGNRSPAERRLPRPDARSELRLLFVWRSSCLQSDGMTNAHAHERATRTCARCGGEATYTADAIVPGNPLAPRGSRAAAAHVQPAWRCLACGHLEPHERRARNVAQQRL